MTEVKNRTELKAALKRGETEFHTTNKNLLYGSALVSKFKNKSELPPAGTQGIVIDTTVVIAMTIILVTTTIALYAIYKNYDIEVDIPNGRIKATKKK